LGIASVLSFLNAEWQYVSAAEGCTAVAAERDGSRKQVSAHSGWAVVGEIDVVPSSFCNDDDDD